MMNDKLWRVGSKVPLNVYDGEGNPVCQCHSEVQSQLIVAAVNYARAVTNIVTQGSGVEVIALERMRQKVTEGYTAEHDAGHANGELVSAALCYLEPSLESIGAMHQPWPIDVLRHTNIRRLVIAGALIAAEIDRLTALEKPEPGDDSVPLDPAARGKA